jgi:transcriptional regulator with GAF, ATPase, and Fis domain
MNLSTSWVTCSKSGRSLLSDVEKYAVTPLSIYISGETGTGKEVIARTIHQKSHRSKGRFIPVHCGALPSSLAESELFGHVKGAFTGAIQSRPGALLQAHQGTLFLDEIGDLPLDIQVKLLRFLEDGEIKPVGSDQFSRAQVRILCATHYPLRKLVAEGKFRQDLYYRLASINLDISPLRERPEDIVLLSKHFSNMFHKTLTIDALEILKGHPWPGNTRELRHAIERACGSASEATLNGSHFQFLAQQVMPLEELNPSAHFPSLKLREIERMMLVKALNLTEGHRAQAAKLLGVARSTIFEMMKRHNVHGRRCFTQ